MSVPVESCRSDNVLGTSELSQTLPFGRLGKHVRFRATAGRSSMTEMRALCCLPDLSVRRPLSRFSILKADRKLPTPNRTFAALEDHAKTRPAAIWYSALKPDIPLPTPKRTCERASCFPISAVDSAYARQLFWSCLRTVGYCSNSPAKQTDGKVS